jgi:anti-sigma B factor antagonist
LGVGEMSDPLARAVPLQLHGDFPRATVAWCLEQAGREGASLLELEAPMHDDQVRLVHVAGDVDLAAAPAFRARLQQAIDSDHHQVMVDLGDVTFMDSTGLVVLAEARHRLQTTQRALHITRVSAPVRRLFELAGLSTAFDLPQLDGEQQA